MRWILYIVGGLAGLVALVAGIGALLPKEHAASQAAEFHRPPEAVWQAITDYEKFPSWRADVKSVTALPGHDGRPSWREELKGGGAIPLEVDEMLPNQRLVTRIADPNLPFGGTWTMEITPTPAGCRLRITERGEVRNVIFRFVSRFVLGYTGTMKTYLESLGAKFGEKTQVTG